MDEKSSQKYIKFVLDDEKVVIQTKARIYDIGYDLTAIGVVKKISDSIT